MNQNVRVRLGDALVERGLLDPQQLEVALSEQKRAHRPLGEILMSLGFVHPEHIANLIAESLGVPFVRARDLEPDAVLVSALDQTFVRQSGAFPIALEDGSLRIAMTDPGDPDKLSRVRERFPYPLAIVMITDGDLTVLIRRYLSDSQGEVAQLLRSAQSAEKGAEFPVERVTLALLLDGVNQGATDIHIEPEEKVTRVRFRIDGVLHQRENLPRAVTEAMISRIKILSDLDIAERRRPQDGRLRIKAESREVDMRVSIMPCTHGENVVLRILDRGTGAIPLSQLGFSHHARNVLRRVSARPHGLFLVTGPTGSGKTTTLYSMLGEVDAIHRNVATIDRMETRLSRLRSWIPVPMLAHVIDAFHGGLLQEKLYSRGLLRYQLLVARRSRDREPDGHSP